MSMVDTIVMRVHDLNKHSQMVRSVSMNFKGTSFNTISIEKSEYENMSKSPFMNERKIIDYYRNDESSIHLVRYKSQDRLNNSGHYYFHAFENRDRDFLELNFSIPKYIFGTNILMLVEHCWDKNFVYANNQSLDYNLKKSYELLINFINSFFKREFIDCPVDFSCVEINRIDFCFNQLFDSKKHALEYLEYQKQLRKKHSRTNSNTYREYETSFMYTTKRHSMKVYHKGAEYIKNDRKEHKRINKEKGFELFDIDGLQRMADRILRYEVTFRDTMLSYLYNHKIFRKGCPIHAAYYQIYKKVEANLQKNNRIAERIGFLKNDALIAKFKSYHPYIHISKEDLMVHKRMSKLLNHNREFILKTNEAIDEYNSRTITTRFEPRAHFSRSLFLECAKFLKSFIKEFQIKEKPSECAVRDRIDEYNLTHRHKLPKNEMIKFYALMQNLSLEDIRKKGFYSRATFFRYKNRFEKIGITKNSMMVNDFINASIDLNRYHSDILFNKSLFKR